MVKRPMTSPFKVEKRVDGDFSDNACCTFFQTNCSFNVILTLLGWWVGSSLKSDLTDTFGLHTGDKQSRSGVRQELKVNKKPHSYPLEQIRNQLKVLKLPEKNTFGLKLPTTQLSSEQIPNQPKLPPHRVILTIRHTGLSWEQISNQPDVEAVLLAVVTKSR